MKPADSRVRVELTLPMRTAPDVLVDVHHVGERAADVDADDRPFAADGPGIAHGVAPALGRGRMRRRRRRRRSSTTP